MKKFSFSRRHVPICIMRPIGPGGTYITVASLISTRDIICYLAMTGYIYNSDTFIYDSNTRKRYTVRSYLSRYTVSYINETIDDLSNFLVSFCNYMRYE